jgi:hypothetical protein
LRNLLFFQAHGELPLDLQGPEVLLLCENLLKLEISPEMIALIRTAVIGPVEEFVLSNTFDSMNFTRRLLHC